MAGEEEITRRLTLTQRTAYGVGHIMNDICAAMWFSYTLLFFQVILGMPPALAGTMLLIGQVADAVATPIVGILADRAGGRKTWHMLGTALVVLSFPLIFSPCPGCPTVPQSNSTAGIKEENPWEVYNTASIWLGGLYYTTLIIIFQTGWAIVQISHLALIPDLTPIQSERAELTAIRYTASVCSSVFIYLVTWFVLHLTAGEDKTLGPDDAYKFRYIVLVGLMVGGVFSLLFHWILKSPATFTQNQKSNVNFSLESIKHDTKTYFKSSLLYQVSVLYVASRLFLTLSLVYMPLYLVESLGDRADYIATVPLVSYISSFLSSLGIKLFSSCIGSRTIYLIGALICVGACIWIGVGIGHVNQTGELFGVATLLGAGSSVTMVASLCLTADLIGSQAENGAFVYSVVTFADKLLNGIVVMFIEEFECKSFWVCPHYYRDVLAYACGGSAVLGLLALITIYVNSRNASSPRVVANGHACQQD